MHGPVAIILAAGHGKRMKSEKAKVLHEVCGQPMIHYVVDAARTAGCRKIVVVVGYAADQVRAALCEEPDIVFAEQIRQLGTGDAVRACRGALDGYSGPVLVLVGDMPLIRAEPLLDLLSRQKSEAAACLLGTALLPDPTGFGRVLRDTAHHFLRIIEQRDCRPEELEINEVNPSCYVFELPLLWEALDQLRTDNAQGEFYLTDAPEILMRMKRKVLAECVLRADDVLGVNTRQHLAEAHKLLQARIAEKLMSDGVSVVDPLNTYFDSRVQIGQDTVVYPFSAITGRVTIGKNCRIGPFAHVRDGTVIEDGSEINAFVEINRSQLGPNVIARHLAYLGDATVGAGANIGAGAVTANFDGRQKHPTEIGAGAIIGSGSVLVAPVRVGEEAVVGSGAVVTKHHDVPARSTVVGVPARPVADKKSHR